LQSFGTPLPSFLDTPSLEAAFEAGKCFGYPFMLKNKRLAYDGRGNAVVKSNSEVEEAFIKLGKHELYAEQWVPFEKELAVMVARTKDSVVSYPVVETIQKDNICHTVVCPAQISSSAIQKALNIATTAVESFTGIGIYGVELFLLHDGSILLNEIAPRSTNSH